MIEIVYFERAFDSEFNERYYFKIETEHGEYVSTIKLIDGQIMDYTCTCPHGTQNINKRANGKYCKHLKKAIEMLQFIGKIE